MLVALAADFARLFQPDGLAVGRCGSFLVFSET
jgi:hypothetical protein